MKPFYPQEYREKGPEEANQYDYGLLQLAGNLEEDYGYIGIDTSNENNKANEIQVCGFPKKNKMYHSSGNMKSCDSFLYYRIPT